jgi:isopentenyldiphosphate isomerase
MPEMIDIYDANLRFLGSMEREQAHLTGQWHRTFHCWIVNTADRSLFFQVRSFTSKTHPGKLDISAAGHLTAGETIEDGIREVEEELGIEVRLSELIDAGQRVEVSDKPNGPLNREYQSVFLLPTTKVLTDFSPDPGEVAGFASIPIDRGLDLFAERVSSIEVPTVDVRPDGVLVSRMRSVTKDEFIPRIPRYYMAALILAERVCDGKQDIAIS